LSSTLKDQIGNNYEYFELNFDQNKNKFSESATMIIDLDPDKEFSGIYKVTNNQTAEKLYYKKLGNNQIEVKVDELGEYLITYKEDNEVDSIEESSMGNEAKEKVQDDSKENDFNMNILIIIVIILLLIILSAVLVFKRNKENEII